ncbi:dihydropteroate synthase [Brachybacterium halotolerans subsp. kimchii]|uniref:dihydropteroate synthase n=1 Tax=Brachybacterium halotolerans TaxID=2795215 RepID=UPI001E3A875A|nr:dihydropteroate synthase [Brachybacterium halotolerans]UEJ84185.1 dihydropteroate synthase [Brachybacterium halotolerans subsp. kimchii]
MEPEHRGMSALDLTHRVAVMAVVNRTPDSFYDKGRTFVLDQAVASAVRAVERGADWVDIGGVPFGRGPAVSVEEEIERVVPVIERLTAAHPRVIVSVDTNRAAVARAALAAGAAVINDTSGLTDPEMARVVAEGGAHVILCHSAGRPREEKPAAHYEDVVDEVRHALLDQVARAEAAGVPRDRIIVDPGHDLDKNTLHSLEITRRLEELTQIGLPLLVAVSNKDFIGESIDRPQGERLAGSLAAMTVCILKGARIVRMHDVPETVDAVRMTEAILGLREPVRLEHNMHPTHNV